jgi:hypothetical protein
MAVDSKLATTQGHYLSEATWLDTHYQVARVEYEDAPSAFDRDGTFLMPVAGPVASCR